DYYCAIGHSSCYIF
nr:immunoglobulin light chain junction region [Macaca mulatta]